MFTHVCKKNNFESQCLRFVNVVVSGRFAPLTKPAIFNISTGRQMHIFSNIELKTSPNLTIRERLPMYIRKNNFDSQCLRFVNVVVSGRFAPLTGALDTRVVHS